MTHWRPLAPRFVNYFEANYAAHYMLWLRCCYLRFVPEHLHHRFTTGTQIAESGFGKLKEIELATRCGGARGAAQALLTPPSRDRPMLRTRYVDWFLITTHIDVRRRYQKRHIALMQGWEAPRRTYKPPAPTAPSVLEAAPAPEATDITPLQAPARAVKKPRISTVEEAGVLDELSKARNAGVKDELLAGYLHTCMLAIAGARARAEKRSAAAALASPQRSPRLVTAVTPARLLPEPGAMPGMSTMRVLSYRDTGKGRRPPPKEPQADDDEPSPPPHRRLRDAAVPAGLAHRPQEKEPFVRMKFTPGQLVQARLAKTRYGQQLEWPAQVAQQIAQHNAAIADGAGPSGHTTAV